MQEICLGKREVEDDIPQEERKFEPLKGSLTPSQKRRILERQSRAKAREKELETTSIEG